MKPAPYTRASDAKVSESKTAGDEQLAWPGGRIVLRPLGMGHDSTGALCRTSAAATRATERELPSPSVSNEACGLEHARVTAMGRAHAGRVEGVSLHDARA